jgi:porin
VRGRIAGIALAVGAALAAAAPARADDPDTDVAAAKAPVKLTVLEIVDLWRNTEGGVSVGDEALSKLRVSATVDGDEIGHPGFKAHVQLFATNGQSFSLARVGDIQTLSNIDAPTAVRLFDLWAEQSLGDVTLRAGLMDVNLDFDAIAPAQLFVNSSHGIGPDLSKSGVVGPTIFPVSTLAAEASWKATKRLTLKVAASDGVPGDADHPGAFAAVNLGGQEGAMLLGQADTDLGGDAQASLGVWGYTTRYSQIFPARIPAHGSGGVYGFIQGPLGKDWTGWVRVGAADPQADIVASYLGFGVVKAAPFPGRKDDQLGLAVARAGFGGDARRALDLPNAETAIEETYRYVAGPHLSLQPDLQYIIHPASAPHLPNALAVGLRLILLGNAPKGTKDEED